MESDTEQNDNRADPQDDQDKEALFENIIKSEMKVERRSRRASSSTRLFISILEKMAEIEMSFLERVHTDAVLMEEVKHLEEFVRNEDVMLKYDSKAFMVFGMLAKDFILTRNSFLFDAESVRTMKDAYLTSKSSMLSWRAT